MNLDDDALSALIRRHATRHVAGEALRAGIRTQVALAEAGRAAPPAAPRPRWAGWRSGALGCAFGVVGALVVGRGLQRVDWGAPPEAELVAAHVRALKVGPLIEVASSDRHTVKPWYQGRLDYAPPVPDLAADGFPLAGGRVEHVREGAVAALVYARNRHLIDVFVWPADAAAAVRPSLHRGFSVVHWADGSMQYWAVSDVERGELERFARLWQARTAAQ